MEEKKRPTLADKWLARLKNHRFVAAAIIAGTVVGGLATFAESTKKFLETIGALPGKPTLPIVVSFPPALSPSPSPSPAAAIASESSDKGARCISAVDLARYETEQGNVDRLIAQGERLVFHEGAPAGLYEKIKNWEDTVYTELDTIDKNHQSNTSFSFFFEHWRTQNRGTSAGKNGSVNAAQMERNLGHLQRVRLFSQRVIAETKARICKQ